MKIHHLIPLMALTVNLSATTAPAEPKHKLLQPTITTLTKEVDADAIPWQADRLLTWDDFACTPQKQGDAVASTSTSLGIAYQLKNDALTFSITCNFSKKKSWGLLKTDYILAHEQAHFDITELHARKLYQALTEYSFNPSTFKKDIAAIYEQIVKEKEAMQEAYDGETDHSRRKRVQYDWLDKIAAMLLETEAFAAYP